jgi:hypothetical protein
VNLASNFNSTVTTFSPTFDFGEEDFEYKPVEKIGSNDPRLVECFV